MPSDPRTIRGPCFDCDDGLDDAWEFCPCRRHGLRSTRKTEPTPKLEPEDLRAQRATEDDAMMTYTANGRAFRFGDLVVAEVCFAPDCDRVGRLMQVRVGRGAFGSDIYLIRDHSGDLRSFHNVRLRHVNDDAFVQAFYLSNGRQPPYVYPESEYEQDAPGHEYRIGAEYPERGFLIQNPKQPHDAQQSFAMMVTHGS